MAKKRVVPSDEQQMVMADIQANPRILFTKEYSHWRDYLRRTSPNYVDRLYENLPYEQQLDIYNNDREAWGALSNNVKGNFGSSKVRNESNEISPYVAGGLGATLAAPIAIETLGSYALPYTYNGVVSGLNAASDYVMGTRFGQAVAPYVSNLLKPAVDATFAFEGAKNFASSEGFNKTWNHFANGEIANGVTSGLGDALDLLMVGQGKPLFDVTKEAVTAIKKGGKYVKKQITASSRAKKLLDELDEREIQSDRQLAALNDDRLKADRLKYKAKQFFPSPSADIHIPSYVDYQAKFYKRIKSLLENNKIDEAETLLSNVNSPYKITRLPNGEYGLPLYSETPYSDGFLLGEKKMYNPSTGQYDSYYLDPSGLPSNIDYLTGTGKKSVKMDGSGIPEDYRNTISKNIDYITSELYPGTSPFGSSVLTSEGNLYTNPHDFEVYMPESMLGKYKTNEWKQISPDTYTFTHPKVGDIDFNILRETPEGFATGQRSWQLASRQHPDWYKQYADKRFEDITKGVNRNPIEQDPLPWTPQELLENANPNVNTMTDALFANKNAKHRNRRLYYLNNAKIDDLKAAINEYGNYVMGGNYKPSDVPLSAFNDPSTNSKILEKMGINGIDKSVTNDQERMKTLFEYSILHKQIYGRGVTESNIASQGWDAVGSWFPETTGGTVHGVGLNTVRGGNSGHGNVYSILQPKSIEGIIDPFDAIKVLDESVGIKELSDSERQQIRDAVNNLGIDIYLPKEFSLKDVLRGTSGKKGVKYQQLNKAIEKITNTSGITDESEYGTGIYTSLWDVPQSKSANIIFGDLDRPNNPELLNTRKNTNPLFGEFLDRRVTDKVEKAINDSKMNSGRIYDSQSTADKMYDVSDERYNRIDSYRDLIYDRRRNVATKLAKAQYNAETVRQVSLPVGIGGAVFGGIAALSNYTGRRSQIIDDALKAGIDIRMKRGEETADEYYDRLERELIQMGFYGQEALEEYNQNNNTKAMGGNISLAPNLMAFGGNMYWGGGPFSTINTNTPGVGLNSSSSKLNYNFNANSNPYAKYGLNSDFTKMTVEQSFKNRTGVDSSILGGGLNSGAASGGSKFAGAMSNMDTYLSGAMTIAGSAINNWNTNEKNDIIKSQNKADINNYVNSINNTNNAFGSRSTEGLISQYNAQANNVLNPSKAAIKWQDLRPSKGKQWANVGSAVGAGASIGTAIMPGWGTVIGAAAGGLIAGVGSIFGRRKAKREEARRNEEIRRANALNIYNADVNASQLAGAFNNATNNQNLENNLYSMANYSAFGGGINISPNMISMANNYMDNNRLATLNKAASLGLDNSFLMPKVKSFAIGGPVDPPKEDEVQPASTTAAYPAIGLDSTLIRNAQEQALLDKSLRTIDKMTYDEVREKANQMIDAYSDPSRFSHTDMTEYLGKNEYAMGGTPNVVSPFNGYSSDMMEVNAGGTHEQNPYGGVRIGVDNRGIPNLVEEGEVIWKSTGNKLIGKNIYDNGGSMNNAFVFTNRVIPHLADLMDVGIAKKRPVSDKEEKKNQKNGKTYADHAKEIHKPLEERPNDSVTQNTVNAQLSRLRDLQNADNAERQAAMEEQAARRGMALGTESMMGNGMMPSEGLAQASRNQMMQDESIQRAASEGLALSDYNRSGGAMLHAFGGNMFKYGTPNPTDPYEDAMASAVPGYKYLLSGQAQSPEEAAKMAYYDNAFSGLTETGKWQSTETPVVGKTPPAPSLSVVNNTSTPTVNLAQTPRTTKDTSDDWYFKGRPTFMRYAPVLGSVLATVADSTGYFSPDYSLVNQLAAEGSKGSYIPVEPAHIGDYLDYRPFDVNYATNKLNAQTAANARGLVNTSNGMRGNVQSALLANQYNAGIGLGELQKAAFEYNLNDRDKVGNFNKDTNKFNATADLEAQKANQAALASLAQYKLNGLGEAAKLRYQMDMDDISRKYADFTSLFNNLGEVGRDNLNYNMAMSNPAYYYGADGRGIIGYKGKMTKDDKYGWRKRKAKKRVDPSETMGYLIG